MCPNRIVSSRPCRLISKMALWACASLVFFSPGALRGEVLYLKDGSAIRGSVVKLEGDTLTFDPAFGGRIKIARSVIARIVFVESAQPGPGPSAAGGGETASGVNPAGKGALAVTFKDRDVYSKVVVKSRKDEARLLEANYGVQLLVANGDTVYSRTDSTTDKTIYKGHVKMYRNNVELTDFEVPLKAGLYHCVVVAQSRGKDWENTEFEPNPLDLIINIDNVQVYPDRTTRIELGIKKGRLRLGKPRFYRVQ